MSNPTVSVVIPVLNEAENVTTLTLEIQRILTQVPIIEIIYVNDGSTDNTITVLQDLRTQIPQIRILSHNQRSGQSAAMMTGARAARGDLIVTMDGDGQNDPADIPNLYNLYLNQNNNTLPGNSPSAQAEGPVPFTARDPRAKPEGLAHRPLGLVIGQRCKRHDNYLKCLSSRIANTVRGTLLHDGVRDTGCSLKLIRRDVYLRLPYFSHMHRFLPALVIREGFQIATIDVGHRPRLRGVSKYNLWNRLWVGIVDLFGVMWLNSRAKMPKSIKEI